MSGKTYDDNNRGVLYEEAEKRSEKSPDFGGDALITPDLAGTTIEMAGWTRMGQRSRLISLKFSLPQNKKLDPMKPGEGRLYPRASKPSEKAADFDGACHIPENLTGKKIRIAAWRDEDGTLSVKVSEKRARTEA